jgi:hypothetical protein
MIFLLFHTGPHFASQKCHLTIEAKTLTGTISSSVTAACNLLFKAFGGCPWPRKLQFHLEMFSLGMA